MNIVKGVADLIRRTSSGQTGDSPGAQGERLSPPTPRIHFSEVDDEAVLSSLWQRYENTVDKVEKKRLFHVFLKQFLTVFNNWEPVNGGQLPEAASTIVQTAEYSTGVNDIVVGCSAGHPAEIILTLTEEIVQLTTLVSELNTGVGRTATDLPAVSISFTSEGLPVLDALKIITRSLHNCRVFGYYGGIQKLTALMKGVVVQLKTMAGVLSADESFSNLIAEKMGFLQRVLVYVVSIICSFIDLNSNVYEKAQMYSSTKDFSVIGASSSIDFSNSFKGSLSEARLHWHQKAVVSVMEAGGLNWLVELLRVIRRLSMKEQWTDMSLQCLTLRTLCFALCDNPRGQNHFRSIGGLEVLLDGLALPSISMLLLKSASHVDGQREQNTLLKIFELHVLSLEVLREAIFGNVNNLQFLCENGRVHKFANSFCSPAFMLQEFKQQMKDSVLQDGSQTSIFDLKNDNSTESYLAEPSAPLLENISYHQLWNDCVVKLSRVLCSFLLAPEDVKFRYGQATSGRIPTSISSVYAELSIKWVMRVLLTVFPCIKACSNQNEFPNHLWFFISTLQHCVLNAFRKVLISSPALLEVFRREGVWDLIFSENFFYFGSASEEFSEEFTPFHEGIPENLEKYSASGSDADKLNFGGIEIIQIEAISFVELAATSNGSVHNLPELSTLLEALEQSACNPEVASVLAKSLLRILQLSSEKTVASFKTLNAASRVLKVACILAQESKRSGNMSPVIENNHLKGVTPHGHQRLDSTETVHSWTKCMETCMELFMEFFSVADDARNLVLRDSTCIDCLFELFWEEGLRDHVLRYILDLMKITSLYEEDRKAMLYICSKYLETFTIVKEREKSFTELSINLLVGMMDILQTDPVHYQALFRDGECFLHVVSLLNGNLDEANGERLVLVVLQTLTCLLARNDASKAAFRALVGKGYQTLQSLLLDFCQWRPSEALLNALLGMLVDGKFEIEGSARIKSSESLRHYGLSVFQQLLKDSLSNRASCVAAGMLNFLLDWFVQEGDDSVILKIAQLIQVIGGHSISGKDIRKIFALLRSEKVGTQQPYCSLLLTTVLSMLNEKGPTAFFDLNGNDSGIIIKTPVQWPLNKGFSFSCWLRVENFPRSGTMGLFKFLTENGRGCFAAVAKDKLIYESINLKQQCLQMHVNLVRKKWHFLCITHTIGRAFSGGSLLRCYLDGDLVSSERCRYAKVNDLLTSCSFGTKIILPQNEEDDPREAIHVSFPFLGQIGPLYLFADAISSEQVKAVHSLGPSYMYSFLDNEAIACGDNPMPSGIFDAKDGLASKIIFGLNAQASDGKTLFNVSPVLDHALDKNLFEATIMVGTQLCSRRMLQEIIYCVGGISVFFPLITQSDRYENAESGVLESTLLLPVAKERLTAEVIELIASVLDENLANQQQMHHLSGFSVLGFLLQSVPPQQLNMETLSALKNLFNVVSSCGLAELLMKEAISAIFLNPLIWLYTVYKVQRELYMFLIEQFDNDPRLLKSLCRLPRVIDIIRQCYWDNVKSRFAIGVQPLLHPITKQVIGERPGREEIHKIRLLLLSLGEMSLRQNIAPVDIKALIAFFETSNDMTCIEDVLHMVIRAVSQKPLLVSFLEQVNLLGGCHIFVNLLQREYEPIRLLSLQFLGRLLVGLPSEKKPRFFNLAVGRSKSLPENSKKISSRMQPLFSAISDRLFKFPQTDNLRATLFDVLLGGASPRQVLQKNSLVDKQRSRGNNSHFFLPQILLLIFRFLSGCGDASARMKIISDLLDLLDSNPLNIEALMEYGWNAWLTASLELDVVKDYRPDSRYQGDYETNEKNLVMRVFSVVLCHYIHFIKGGWQQLEETLNFLLLHCEQGRISCRNLLCDIYDNLIQRLVDLSAEENIFSSQPCRDNTLYFLRLVDEMLISEVGNKLPFPANSAESYLDSLELESQKDYTTVLHEVLQGEFDDKVSGNPRASRQSMTSEDDITGDKWWNLLDNLWIVISEMNGKGPSKIGPRISASVGPSFGQRARGLVESLNIPAAEMAAVVVSGGIGNALSGKPNKNVDKAMALRGERCPRIVFRLLILYLCISSLERASRCVQQFISLLPTFLASDDEQSKSRLQLFIWSLLIVRSQYGMLDDGARFHVIAHVIRETVNSGKSMLATSMVGRDDSFDSSSYSKEMGSIHNLIQKDRVLSAVSDESKYVKMLESDRSRQLQELLTRMDENSSLEINNQKAFEDEIQSSLHAILASDESRRAAFLLAHEEEQQNVAEKWMHMFRTLIDERGPWSANPFPNGSVIHWKLDKTEDAWRRRPKLRQNYHFDEKLCHGPSTSPSNEATFPNSESKSSFVGHIPEQMKQFLLKGVHRITDEGSSEPGESDAEPSGQLVIPEDPSDGHSVEVVKSSSDQMDIIQDKKEFSSPSLETETSEVVMSIPCVLVTPKRKLAGQLAVMKDVLHFFGEFLVEGTVGSSVFKNLNASRHSESARADHKPKSFKWSIHLDIHSGKGTSDNIEAENLHKKPLKNVKRHRRWSIGKIKAVHWTRYLLRYTAVEIFFSDSVSPIFINFASQKDAKEIGTLVVSTRNELLFPRGSSRDKSGTISFVDRRVALEMAETARESWRRRDITNFEYLMILNTLAGRSYNDLTQYPVFPWILADYSSEVLDFNKSSTFRDLSKPVGALDSKRFEVFEDRYRNFCDPDIPSFYYGSHYSSMGIVLYYLLRLEPFTSLHRNLQGGKFDHADRLFQSIEGTYRNCLANTSDVKELIPEFYYMPEFLINSNSYHLGVKQDGEPISDVSLPPWAKGSPELFVSKNREALESEYVSSNLHHWIDLVFGYKQRGKPAVEAANIFYYLTYEGAVDLDAMDDELQRSAIEDQIANFGQTPIQIFRKKHPRRGPPIPIAHPLYFAPASINLTSVLSCMSYPPSAVLYVGLLDSNIIIVNQGLTLSVKMWLTTQLQSGGNFTFSGSQDPFFGVGSDILSPRKIGSPLAENVELGAQCFATMQTPTENFLISCGNWENSFQLVSLSDGRMVQSIRQHKDVVSCVAVTADGSILATGSYDTTVMMWEVLRVRVPEKRVRNMQTEVPRKDCIIAETPFHILCGHDDIITCLYVSVELDIVISGSKDGTCVFHTLRDGRYVRSLLHPSGSALSKLVASRHGRIVLYADGDLSLHLYSINGKHLASSESIGRLNCVELSGCGEFLVCAGDQGQIVVRSMNTLEVVKRYNGVGKIITSLTVTPEECFLAGTKDGSLLVYSIENPQLRKDSLPRNPKSKAYITG
ncbi:BEACH domain-containing protein B-like isoform X4 [Durio zibethinus]|uniref:BEACH domain-containing protein B-like isoform X4 n=1 Tax=Durio zibethinus TaxID=66656 RepID=A0A6P6B861_DURZI|nr:BEACH domain-containing protein B-like isoform X4 [Durio zibethinus]